MWRENWLNVLVLLAGFALWWRNLLFVTADVEISTHAVLSEQADEYHLPGREKLNHSGNCGVVKSTPKPPSSNPKPGNSSSL